NPNDTVEQRRRNLVGFALGVYRVDDLIEKVLEKEFYTDRGIHLLLYDRSAQKEGQLLYAHDNGSGGGHDDAPSLEGALKMPHLSHQFDVGGRQWVLMARPNVEFETYTNPLPLLALFLGLLITTMLLFSLRSITRRTRTIAQKVEEQTARLQRSEAYNQAVHDTVVDGIITINPQGVIQSCNPATGQMFGYDSGELPGRKINTLMPDHYAKAHDGYLHHYMETGEEHVIGTGREVEGQRSDGSVFPMDLAVSRMEIDGEAFFTGVVRDITERKRVDKMKAEFISTVSHELRTPLTSIHGAMGLVAGGAAGELSEQAMKLVTIAVNNSDRLVRLINDILDVEKIEAGKMQFNNKHMPLGPIVEQAVEENRAYAEEHGSSYQLQISGDDPVVDVDADRIRQVLDNLLSNAAKYGAEEDKIDVTVVVTGQLVQVTVQDHGPGIPEEFQNRIFSKFAQADSSDTRQKGGTGLGLSIAKAIVEQHGGQLWFETEKGEGTRFIIQLPVAKAFEEMAVNISESSCVLLCEDDPDVGKLLQLMLEKEGVASDLASSAEEALVMLRQKDYQAMTLDLMLPGRDGVSLLNELRETEQFKDLPVVVVTAKSKSEGDAFGVMQVSDWLTKPIEEQRLKHAVMLAIRSREEGGKAQVLHVEDDPDIITVVSTMLDECAVIEFASGLSEAQQLLDKKHYDLVILDISLPDGSGLDLLPRLSQFTPAIPVVIFSALEVDSNTAAKVAGVLVKSRGDSGRLAVMVKELIKTPTNINEAKRN
ncbi:MAG: response regulator, partial [Sedimenticola sp.]